MKSTETYLNFQYERVRGSRKALFGFCGTLSHQHLLLEHSTFGRGGSVRNLLVHIANTYEFWIIRNGLQRDITFTGYGACETLDQIGALFARVDLAVNDFISKYAFSVLDPVSIEISGAKRSIPALELFTHVITHEFHHKGQIVSLCRHMGYAPVDTDIIW